MTATSSVLIYIGKGDGAFLPGPSYPIASMTTLQSLIVGDFDGDGKPDLLVGKSNNAVAILLGVGDGTFLAPVDVAAGKSERGWVAGDFDGDGGLDIAAASGGVERDFRGLEFAHDGGLPGRNRLRRDRGGRRKFSAARYD